jgi:hypothetical protein
MQSYESATLLSSCSSKSSLSLRLMPGAAFLIFFFRHQTGILGADLADVPLRILGLAGHQDVLPGGHLAVLHSRHQNLNRL